MKVAYSLTCCIVSVYLQTKFSLLENVHISKTRNISNVKPFYRKAIISKDLEICISVPLTIRQRMPHIYGFLDYFSFSQFLATSCCF